MKTITVKVIPNSKQEKITEENSIIKVHVKKPAIEGKANGALIKALAEFYKTKKSSIRIIKGQFSREKIIQMDF